MTDRVILSIGTKKGLFVAEASQNRRKFELRGPFSPGVAVYSALIDTRVACSSDCPECGHSGLTLVPFHRAPQSYRAVARCPACFAEIEF